MAGQFIFTPQEFQEAAHKYRKELLMLPIIGLGETLKFMTSRPGIRYKESVGFMSGDAQFGPYKPSRSTDFDLHVDFRTLETFFGSVVTKFEPNSAIRTILGTGATKGDGQMQTPTAKHVLALVAQKLSEHLNDAIWNAERNPNGDTTKDLFDGFDTITSKEITAGTIAADQGNYIKLTEDISDLNAVDIAKHILFSLDDKLRAQNLNLYCTQEFVDHYNEAYLNTHAAIPYNTQYGHTTVEGSNGKLTLIPLSNKKGSKFFHIAPKSNMLLGYDTMGDECRILVEKYEPFVLSYIATMFFGTQFESIDRRKLMVVELNDTETPEPEPEPTPDNNGGETGGEE